MIDKTEFTGNTLNESQISFNFEQNVNQNLEMFLND
jgi:hypothetical protein